MTAEPRQLPVPQRRMLPARRRSALPVLAAVASRALPVVTASVAAAATMLTAERAVRELVERIVPATKSRSNESRITGGRTTITEWVTIERSRRSR
jgi:hypothetical protein